MYGAKSHFFYSQSQMIRGASETLLQNPSLVNAVSAAASMAAVGAANQLVVQCAKLLGRLPIRRYALAALRRLTGKEVVCQIDLVCTMTTVTINEQKKNIRYSQHYDAVSANMIQLLSARNARGNFREVYFHSGAPIIIGETNDSPLLADADRQIYYRMHNPDIEIIDKERGRTEIQETTISVFSYKLQSAELRKYLEDLTSAYYAAKAARRANQLYLYTLVVPSTSDDNADFRETAFSSNRTFANMWFDRKDEVLRLLDRFMNNKEWFDRRGLPHRLGFALSGEPGTGKSSFIKALMHHTRRHAVIIPLGLVRTKLQLSDVFFENVYVDDNKTTPIPFDRKIFVFEDVDAESPLVRERVIENQPHPDLDDGLSENDDGSLDDDDGSLDDDDDATVTTVGQKRGASASAVKSQPKRRRRFTRKIKPEDATLADLLNLLDGLNEMSGRIVVFTTNHVDKLDKALMRPGRIDEHLHMGPTSRRGIADMYKVYFDEDLDANAIRRLPDGKITGARLANIYYRHADNPRNFYNAVLAAGREQLAF
jgi:hypothetical protein